MIFNFYMYTIYIRRHTNMSGSTKESSISDTKDESDKMSMEFLNQYVRMQDDAYERLLDIPSIQSTDIKKALVNYDYRHFSHINRLTKNVQTIKYDHATSKTDIITTCFKVSYDSTSCIYGYMHSACGIADNDIKSKSKHVANSNPKQSAPGITINHEFICTGPTFRSQDGEYRGRLIKFSQFTQFFEKFTSVLDIVEEMVVRKIQTGELQFFIDFYFPDGCKLDRKIMDEFVNNLRMPIKMFMICWLRDFHYIHRKIAENHMNPAYQYIIYQPEDAPVYDSILKLVGSEESYDYTIDRIVEHFANINEPILNLMRLSCGQKIFPVTVIESIRNDDINYSIWREMYITNLVSNLVLNLVCPSFPFLGAWFYIQHSHAGLFDNVAMFDKYKQSAVAEDVTGQLRAVDKYNYTSKNNSKHALSDKFLQLSRNINKSIVYADSEIRLTDLSVCVTSEYVGRTLRDIPNIIANDKHLHGMDLIFSDYEMFCKHMFEYIYAFYCMNSRLWVMHGDLHMNNVTIFRLYRMKVGDTELVKNPKVLYVIDDSGYMFSHNGLFSMIIDLSRAIIGDASRIESEFGATYATMYFHDQQNRILHIIHNYFPDILETLREGILRLARDNFPLLFKITSVIDTFIVMTNIKSMFAVDDIFTKGKIKLADGIIGKLDKLITESQKLFIENINIALRGEIKIPDDIDWPNLVIIRNLFAENVPSSEQLHDPGKNIVEVFRNDNKMINNIEDYDNWGDLISLEPAFKLWQEVMGTPADTAKTFNRFLKNFSETEQMRHLVSRYIAEEADVVQFEPWMMQ